LKGEVIMKFLFGDIVVINKNQIGVIVKVWEHCVTSTYEYEVYNRMTNRLEMYAEENIERYRVRHKYLNEEELKYQWSYV
jgi:hypothetical protein